MNHHACACMCMQVHACACICTHVTCVVSMQEDACVDKTVRSGGETRGPPCIYTHRRGGHLPPSYAVHGPDFCTGQGGVQKSEAVHGAECKED